MSDSPKSLADANVLESRLAQIDLPHIAPLSAFVRELRIRAGAQYSIPYFDPLDGGINAECLYLLEAPGPKATASGFVSRNNPDETAKNFFLLNQEAGIARSRTAIWNTVPWYVGDGKRIRATNTKDIAAAMSSLCELLVLLPKLRFVVLVGRKAARARFSIEASVPHVQIFSMPHPSPMFVNRAPTNRIRLQEAVKLVAIAMEVGKDGA